MQEASGFQQEIGRGDRFGFGENWKSFLANLTEERILQAERSLREMLEIASLEGVRFLDVGSGSGLFSLAAMRLGAGRVHSFDYDPQSVACTRELKSSHFPDAENWSIEQGSILSAEYVERLGHWDIVYSWGVLHHTGDMWRAMETAALPVAPGGRLFVSIYNDQGRQSRRWAAIKRTYNKVPRPLRLPILLASFIYLWGRPMVRDLLRGRPFHTWTNRRRDRGMSPWRDLVDWVGGWPFQVAKPEQVFDFFKARGFLLEKLKTCRGGLGCNEFVFRKAAASKGRAERKAGGEGVEGRDG